MLEALCEDCNVTFDVEGYTYRDEDGTVCADWERMAVPEEHRTHDLSFSAGRR